MVGMFKTVSYGIIGGIALTILAISFHGCAAGVSHSPPLAVPR